MQSQVYYPANPNQTQVIFSKILTQVSSLFLVKLEIDEISIYKSSLIRCLLLAISGQFKKDVELPPRVLFTVPFATISFLTISQSALDFAVSAKILLKAFNMW